MRTPARLRIYSDVTKVITLFFINNAFFKNSPSVLLNFFIFIFIMINRMNTDVLVLLLIFQNTTYYFWMITLASGCCLASAWFFCKFQPGVAYESVSYKKSVYFRDPGSTNSQWGDYSQYTKPVVSPLSFTSWVRNLWKLLWKIL